MRPQDWAFLTAAGLACLTVGAALYGSWALAVAGAAATAGAGGASRILSRRYPAPMPSAFRWGLLWPRGFHSSARLAAILEPRPSERLLELGPGVGVHALPIARLLGHAGTLNAIDIQPTMLVHLARRAARASVTNVVSAVADGCHLPYAADTFDGAYLVDVLGEMSDQREALQELRRVLKPGGRLVVGEHFVDPDFVPHATLRAQARQAGFAFERTTGTALVYFVRFRKTLLAA